MNIFGFKISPSSAINLDKVDRSRFDELCRIEPDALRCMACGSCSATCPASIFSGMSVRKVLLALQRGKEELHALRQMHHGMPTWHKHPQHNIEHKSNI